MTRNKSFANSNPVLYLIATPIGNLKEMSPRALEVINEMDIIAAEDTRNCFSLLANYGIKKELFSLREHNEIEASEKLLEKIKQGKIIYKKEYKNKNKEHRVSKQVPAEKSIEYRPKEALLRTIYGYWEGDLVVGKQGTKTVLFTLTERMTRQEIIIKLPNMRRRNPS